MNFDLEACGHIPYSQCSEASIVPLAKGCFCGDLLVGGRDYKIEIATDYSEKSDKPEWLWARIELGEVCLARVDEVALKTAKISVFDPSYIPIKINLSDGRVAYMETWTCDFPNDKDLDLFLSQGRAFIENNSAFLTWAFMEPDFLES